MRELDSLAAPTRESKQPRTSTSLVTTVAASSAPAAAAPVAASASVSSDSGGAALLPSAPPALSSPVRRFAGGPSPADGTNSPGSSNGGATAEGMADGISGSLPGVVPPLLLPVATSVSASASSDVSAAQQQTQSRVHYLEALVAASNAISAHLEPSRVAEALVAKTAELLNVPGVAVLLLDEQNNLRPASAKGLSAAFLPRKSGRSKTPSRDGH